MSAPILKTGVEGSHEILERAFPLWRKAQVVHEGLAWEGKPEARAIAEEIAASHPECEAALVAALDNENSLVVAYALLCLELMHSIALQSLPEQLLQCRSNITLVMGSFHNGMDLGGLARQIQKRAIKRCAARVNQA